jgi:hypothetical protein
MLRMKSVFRLLEYPAINSILLMKLRRKFDLRIEPHPFHYSDFYSNNPFANEIKKIGTPLI